MKRPVPSELSCQEVVELVTDYLERRMPSPEQARFEQHLVYCAPCAEYVRQTRKVVELAGKTAAKPPDKDVEQRLATLFLSWRARR